MKPLLKVIQLHKNQEYLIKKALKNSRDAQQALYTMFAPKMLSHCRYYIKDMHHAEEVMHNGFFKVFTQLQTFQHQGSFEGWVRKIMTREAISYLRQKKQMVFTETEHALSEESPVLADSQLSVEIIQNAIDGLPEGYKTVFVMYAIEGYKHHEIASELLISVGTSKSQLFKARQLLQQQLQELNATHYGTK